jgi:hypothetical protein
MRDVEATNDLNCNRGLRKCQNDVVNVAPVEKSHTVD